ncbi:hypothetical protein DOTSEDRAFT_28149 [Dothistroma septosporum NZE10]|uniref:DUF7730 domain-containing protein n=1 Tax=Dothistroma septosporum (strain NZE10 / CBS 128990) TaxID=675120 RepID=N1PFA0_DOTSN|nr:hypothetical protein DOTSEDRAFT_28149 [Dothistroma septosporum NZE10]
MAPSDNHHSSTSNATPRIGFFDLPPEVPNVIYHLALHKKSPVELVRSKKTSSSKKPSVKERHPMEGVDLFNLTEKSKAQLYKALDLRFQVRLLLTCKQIHHEATPILYGGNCFRFNVTAKDMSTFVDTIGTSRQRLRHIIVTSFLSNKAERQKAMSRLKYATNLQKLEILYYDESVETQVQTLRVLMQALHKSRAAVGRTESVVEILSFVSWASATAVLLEEDAQTTRDVKKELQKLLK